MQIQVGSTCLIIGVLLILGYILVIISVITSPTNDLASFNLEFQASLDQAKRIISAKNVEIEKLRAKISSSPLLTKEEVVTKELVKEVVKPSSIATRPGVIVLGMHRSGTSVLGGLLTKMGLNTGGPLIQAAEDNAKGFFERVDVVLQNDYIMKKQKVHYAFNTHKYNAFQGLKDVLADMSGKFFEEGRRGLSFLNDEHSYPWMLKDPRLCITVRTWIPLLNFVPAIIFTYRHPLDVALSMNKREFEKFEIGRGLKLWYVYTMRAIQQTNDLCRVTTSHRAVMKQPQSELDRIYEELLQCGVAVPHKVSPADIADFIDIKLQHGRTTLKDTTCEGNVMTALPPDTWQTTDREHIRLYRECMRVYCALEDGSAYLGSFHWDSGMTDT